MKSKRKEYQRNRFPRPMVWMGFTLLLLLLALAPWSAATAGADDEKDAAPLTVSVTLDKKTPEVVITTVGDRYAVSKQATTIVGLDGRQVDYFDLAVPCDARLVYHQDQGVNQADLITIVRISSSATRDFAYERPE